MAGSKAILVDDIQFVLRECDRFQNELISGRNALPNSPEAMESFYRIPHPTVSWSFQVCGKEAQERLDKIAAIAAKKGGIEGTINTTEVRKKLAEIIVRKFQVEKLPINIQNVERAMSEATRVIAQTRQGITHFIPLHLMIVQQPSIFSIGPVTLHSTDEFRSRILPIILESRRKYGNPSNLISHTLRYFRSFSWVAEVFVPNCDKDTSEIIAHRAAASALDCIHILLEPQNTQKMALGGPNLSKDWRGTLSITENDGITCSFGTATAGSVVFGEDWFERFFQGEYERALYLCGVALESVINPALNWPLSARFLEAAHWFGDAVREKSTAAKVVKYATALERMVMTDEKHNITDIMSQRVAALCCDDPFDSFDAWYNDAKKLGADL